MSRQTELRMLLQEASELSNKPHWDKRDTARNAYLLSAISAVKSGVSLKKVQRDDVNDVAAEIGAPKFKAKKEKRSVKLARDFRAFCLESRDGGVTGGGDPLAAIGHYAGIGYFVPNEFVRDVTKAALELGDEVINPDAVSYIKSTNGRPLTIPVYNDTSNDAAPTNEAALDTVPDVSFPGQVTLGAVTYRQTYLASIDALQDVESSGNLLNVWQEWTAQRVARGVSSRMINGASNSPQQVGLVNQLQNAGCVPIIATGSSANTGGSEDGSNTIGTADLAALVYNLDDMYANSPKCAFWMNRKTLLKLAQLVTKQGLPLVSWQKNGLATIYGYPVRICPTLPTPAASQVTVLFGDGSYIFTRSVQDALSGVRVLRERFIESGQVGLQTITRWHMQLGYLGQGQCPFTILQNHS
jgi:HK97 family phage major capsid protein